MCTHPCFHKTPCCLWCNLCSGKEEDVEADHQEFQDFGEFEDQASDLPQSAACGGFIYVGYVSILCAMMIHLCNRCVREFLILARTWFAFGLPSKTGCDISGIKAVLTVGPLAQSSIGHFKDVFTVTSPHP